MDLSFLTDYYIPVVLVACLIVGYCIKHITWLEKVSNEYILACVSTASGGNSITLETIVYGAFTGLASTGLHQAFKQIIDKNNS